jgi:prevent-host-death family protein
MATKPLPAEKVMNVTDTKQQFSRVINEVARGENYVIVEKSGAPVAAIIDPAEFRRFQRFTAEQREKRARLFERLAKMGDAFGEIPDEELEQELAKAQAEVREEMARARRST